MTTSPAVPPGAWVRDPSRFPAPLTPLFVDVQLRAYASGFQAAADTFASPMPPPSFITVDGWEYKGSSGMVDHSPARVAAFERLVEQRFEAAVLQRWHEELRPAVEAAYRRLQRADLPSLTDPALLAHLTELGARVDEMLATHFTNWMAASVFCGRFGLFCTDQLGLTPPEVLGLLAGCSAASAAPVAALGHLAAGVRADPALRAALAAADAETNPRLRAVLGPWLETHGYRGTAREYSVPTLVETPAAVVRLLRDAVIRLEAGVAGAETRVEESREVYGAALRARLPDEAARAIFDRLLVQARAAYGVRDDDAAFVEWGVGLQRHAFLEAGRRFSARGQLRTPEDVWYLHRPEVEAGLGAAPPPDLATRATERRAIHERQWSLQPPVRLGTPAPAPALPPLSDAAQAWVRAREWWGSFPDGPAGSPGTVVPLSEVRGAAASRGVYRGPACIVRDETAFERLRPGDVLVCPTTTPAWSVLFGGVGALVTDEGGILSHSAIVAREFGIPAVVGTGRATAMVPDGTLIEVDGAAGIVRW